MKRRNPFVQIDRTTIDDPRLSWKATGLMTYFVSKPDGWIFLMDHIIKSKTDGEKSVRSGIKELKEAGYIVRAAFREGGKISKYEFFIYEEPVKHPSSKDIHIDLSLWKQYLEEHKDDDLIDVTVAAIEIKERKKQVSQNRQPEKKQGVSQVSQNGKPENLSNVELVSGFEEAEKEEAENAGLSIINSININSTNIYDDDMEYHSLQFLFVQAGGDPIKRHDIHYKKYKEALQAIGDYKQIKELAGKYFAACKNGFHPTPQIAWFLSDGWRNFIAPTVKKMTRKAKSTDKPVSFQQKVLEREQRRAAEDEIQKGSSEVAGSKNDLETLAALEEFNQYTKGKEKWFVNGGHLKTNNIKH
jgi:hypothetical protein